jgi:hypothetical protein
MDMTVRYPKKMTGNFLFNRKVIAFITVTILLQSGFLFFALKHQNIHTSDSYEYLHAADNIASGYGWYSGDLNESYQPRLESRRPPVYPAFISIILTLLKNKIFILIFQNLLSIINFCGLIFLLFRFITDKKFIGWILIPAFFFPSQFIFSNMIMSEILFQTFIFWSFLFMILYLFERKNMQLIVHILFITLAILTKPVLYLIWLPEVLFFIFLFFRKKVSFSQLTLSLIPAFAVLVISLHNEKRTGYFHYSSIKTTNLLGYNAYKTLRLNHSEAEAKQILANVHSEAVNTTENYKELSQKLESAAIEIKRNNLTGYTYLHLKGMWNFFIDPGRHDMFTFFVSDFSESEQGISYYFQKEGMRGVLNYFNQFNYLFIFYSVLIFLMNIFILFSVLAFIINKNIPPEIKIFTILIIFYVAFVTGPVGSARFKVAVYPEILFTVPFFIESIKNSHFYKKFKWR